MKNFFVFFFLFLNYFIVNAQTIKKVIFADLRLSASNLVAYPEPTDIKYTDAPNGYKPYYISTYARHGSRFMAQDSQYYKPLNILKQANSEGKLTPKGKQIYYIIDSLTKISEGRAGELTEFGAIQHRGIAQRIYKNFPEVFTGKVHIEARSTPVMRCALSMMNECWELAGLYPSITIRADASYHDLYYLNNESISKVQRIRETKPIKDAIQNYQKKEIHPHRFISSIFNDTEYLNKNIDATSFMIKVFDLAGIIQNLDNVKSTLYPYFTKEECYNIWKVKNFIYNIYYGFSPITKKTQPYMQTLLLKNIIQTADTCLAATNRHNLSLRFGHDIAILPLACLLRITNCNYESTNPDSIAEHWINFKITPMASNIQFIFYRKEGQPDLVKILYNELEVTIPLHSDITPYYKWSDFKAYAEKIIAEAPKGIKK